MLKQHKKFIGAQDVVDFTQQYKVNRKGSEYTDGQFKILFSNLYFDCL